MKISIDLVTNTGAFSTDIQRSARTLERELSRSAAEARRAADSVRREQETLAREAAQIQAQSAKRIQAVSQSVLALGGGIAAALGINRFVELADQAQSLDARLRLATGSTAEFKTAQAELFAISQRNNAALADTTQLYARLSASAGDLGASQNDLLKFVSGTSAALRVEGRSGAEAAGALQQLSQALGAGIVRAEEFNSVNDGAQEILRVVARNIEGVDGNLGKLRQRVLDGTLTSKEFFQAFLRGTDELNARAASIPQTVGGALQNFQNVLLRTAGGINESTELTRKFATAINAVSESLSSGALAAGLSFLGQSAAFVVENFAPLATFFVGRLAFPVLFSAAAAAATTLIQTISLLGPVLGTAAAAALGLQTALAPLLATGGLAVLGVSALAAGLVYLATRETDAERTTRELTAAKDKLRTASKENAEAALDEAFAKRQVVLAELEQLRLAAKQSPFVAGVGQGDQRAALASQLDELDVQITEFQRRMSGEFVDPSLMLRGISVDPKQAKEAEALLKAARTGVEQYADQQARVRELVDGGALSQEEANKVLDDARKRYVDTASAVKAAAKAHQQFDAQVKDWRTGMADAQKNLAALDDQLRDQAATVGLTDSAVLAYRLHLGDLAGDVALAGEAGEGYRRSIIAQAEALEQLRKADDAAREAADKRQRNAQQLVQDYAPAAPGRDFIGGLRDARSGGEINDIVNMARGSEELRYDSELIAFKDSRDELVKLGANYDDLLLQAAADHQGSLTRIEREGAEARTALQREQARAAADSFASIAEAALLFGKKGFAIYKAAAIASTLIGTYDAAQSAAASAAKVPIIGAGLAIAAAGAQIALGLARVGQIRAQNFGGGRRFGGSVSAGGLYEVAEENNPELLRIGGRTMLAMGDKSGTVTPARVVDAPAVQRLGGRGGYDDGPMRIEVLNSVSDLVGTRIERLRGLNGEQVVRVMTDAISDNANDFSRQVSRKTNVRQAGSIG